MSASYDYDVVIGGGGMVGASLALLLEHHSQSALKLLVVESFSPPANKPSAAAYRPSFDARSTALSYGSQRIFEQLGLWPALSEQLSAIKTIHVSERGAFASATMSADEMNWPNLGSVIENNWLGNVLIDRLGQQSAIEMACPASIEKAQPYRGGMALAVKSSQGVRHIKTPLLVVADGAQSNLRQQLGIAHSLHSYQQTAVVANICFEKNHRSIAYERFTDEGPMALLPLPNSEQGEARGALVWSQTPANADKLGRCDEAVFLTQLQQRFGHRLGRFTRVGERVTYPLQLLQSREQIRSNVVVMGNAAHALHPVAGQGFNLALRDCARLSDCLTTAHANEQPLGDIALLQRYQLAQQSDQQKTTFFSDKVGAVFSSSTIALSLLRQMGLAAMDVIPSAKSVFVQHAAGLHAGAALGFDSLAVDSVAPPTAIESIDRAGHD